MGKIAIHRLKTWPEPFAAIADGKKPWEFRRDDRGFAVGDVLILEEWDPETEACTGRSLAVSPTYIMRGPRYDIPDGYVVMTLRILLYCLEKKAPEAIAC